MPEQWLSVAEAATQLKVHPRTIERRIASQKLESRRGDNGLVQIKLDLPDDPPPMIDPFETVRDLADRQVDIAAGSASTIVKFAQEATDRATRELAITRQERDVARNQSRTAWIGSSGIAATCLALLGMIGFWAMRVQADSRAKVQGMSKELEVIETDARHARQQYTVAQQRAEDAMKAQAMAEGRLDAYQQQREAAEARLQLARKEAQEQKPRLVDRLASLFATE